MPVFKRTIKDSKDNKILPERDEDMLTLLSFQSCPDSFLVLLNFTDTLSINVYFCLSQFEYTYS